jgi:hypothetical protein
MCACQATLSLSPLLVNKLNKLDADVNGLNGRKNVPQSLSEFIARLKDIIAGAACNFHSLTSTWEDWRKGNIIKTGIYISLRVFTLAGVWTSSLCGSRISWQGAYHVSLGLLM